MNVLTDRRSLPFHVFLSDSRVCVLFWRVIRIVALVLRNWVNFKIAQIAVDNQEIIHGRLSNEFSGEVEVVIGFGTLLSDGQNVQEQRDSIYRSLERLVVRDLFDLAQNAIVVVLFVLVVGLLTLLGLPLSCL